MVAGAMAPQATFAATCGNGVTFLGMDPWYAALECDSEGNVAQSNFSTDADGNSRLPGTIVNIIVVIVKDLMFIGGLLAVVLIMYGGFLMVTSAGSPGAVEKAKKTISGAIVGLIIAILAYAIATTVLSLTMRRDEASGYVRESEVALMAGEEA